MAARARVAVSSVSPPAGSWRTTGSAPSVHDRTGTVGVRAARMLSRSTASRDRHEPGLVGRARLTWEHGAGEQGTHGGAHVPYGGEVRVVGLEAVGAGLRTLAHPGGEALRGGEVVGDSAVAVVADGEGEIQGEAGVRADRGVHGLMIRSIASISARAHPLGARARP
jgi:hypothetical protein